MNRLADEKEERAALLDDVVAEVPVGNPQTISARKTIIDLCCILLNIVSTVMLVFLNNWIFRDKQLKKMQISYAMWHFGCTSIVLFLATRKPFRLFVPIRLPLLQMVPLCTFFAGFLILGNLSLTFNSLGFYQIAKIMTTPVVALLEFVFMGKAIGKATLAALASVCVGVAFTNSSAGAQGTTAFGASIAVSAFTVTAFYQVWIGKKLKDFKVSSPQLLLNQAPISVFLLAFMVPFFDTMPDVSIIPQETLIALVISGFVAALLNLSQFLVIGRMSALTFNVSSNVKMIIILAYGWISEGRPMTIKDAIGIVLALGGASAYSQLSKKPIVVVQPPTPLLQTQWPLKSSASTRTSSPMPHLQLVQDRHDRLD